MIYLKNRDKMLNDLGIQWTTNGDRNIEGGEDPTLVPFSLNRGIEGG